MSYIHQHINWTDFQWQSEAITNLLADVRHRQGRLLGRMQTFGFDLQTEATLQTITFDVLKSSEIEGEHLNAEQVRSSIARRLGMEISGLVPADRHIEGVVEMMMDATQQYEKPLDNDRLFGWHSAMFPAGRSGMYKIKVGEWRDHPMQVVSGAMGREQIHFEAPNADRLDAEMQQFFSWFNGEHKLDPFIKAAIAHFWFVTIHPFDDGNGRIARAIADMQLARADETRQRFYSMSMQIRNERKGYYDILERSQKGDSDITGWLVWFLECLKRALMATDDILSIVLKKAHFWQRPETAQVNERQKLMLNKVLDGFDGKMNSSKWAKIAKCSQDTATRDINQLIEWNIFKKSEEGGRSTSYLLQDF